MENRLSYLRRARGVKQYDLARILEVSPSFLCKIEKGIQEPTENFKDKCAQFFNETAEMIFLTKNTAQAAFVIHDDKAGSNNLWSVRLKKNIKQNKLAEMIGCSPSYLSKIEKGLQEPNTVFKKKCAKILKTKEIELFPDNKTF